MARTKGTSMVECVRVLRRDRERARAVLPPALHRYLEERIQESAWYPEEDLRELMRAVAQLLEGLGPRAYEEMGRFAGRAHLDGDGVYRHLRGDGDPASIARRALALWGSMHDTGRFRLAVEGPGRARIELSDFGLPSRELCRVTAGYIQEVLHLSGLKDAVVRETGCVVSGDALCSWDCRWREEG